MYISNVTVETVTLAYSYPCLVIALPAGSAHWGLAAGGGSDFNAG